MELAQSQQQLVSTQEAMMSMKNGMEAALRQRKANAQATQIEQQRLIINLQQTKTTATDQSISSKVNIAKPANLKGAEDWSEFKHAADTYLAFLDKLQQ